MNISELKEFNDQAIFELLVSILKANNIMNKVIGFSSDNAYIVASTINRVSGKL